METTRSVLITFSCFTGVVLFLIGYILEIVNLNLVGIGILAISISFMLLFREKTVREDLIASTINPTMHLYNNFVNHYRLNGNGVLIPPTSGNKEFKLIVPKNANMDPSRFLLLNSGSKSILFKDGLILIPSGVGLLHLVEKETGISLSSLDLPSLADFLSKSLIGILKIAENIYVNIVGNKVFIQVLNSIFFDSCNRVHIELPNLCTKVCCPLCSLIACIIAKMTERSVIIEDSKINSKERSINLSMRLSKFF